MSTDMRGLCEHVSVIIDGALHGLDPARVRARKRVDAMLERCANTKTHDFAYAPYVGYRRETP